MSLTFSDLDLTNVSEGSALGAGVHLVTISDAKFGPRNDGERPVLELELNSNGATYTDVLRVYSESEAGARISQQRLKQYLVAIDHDNPNKPGDVNLLKGKRCKIKIEPGKSFRRDDGSTGNYKNVTAVYKPDADVDYVPSAAPAAASMAGIMAAAPAAATFDDEIPF